MGNEVTHTPVLVLNAMDNASRMAIPIQVFSTKDIASFNQNELTGGATSTNSITAVSLDPQFRYYTGLDFPSSNKIVDLLWTSRERS